MANPARARQLVGMPYGQAPRLRPLPANRTIPQVLSAKRERKESAGVEGCSVKKTTFKQAQLAHDAKEPPHDCKEEGHDFRKTRVAYIAGEWITEFKCRFCGLTVVE